MRRVGAWRGFKLWALSPQELAGIQRALALPLESSRQNGRVPPKRESDAGMHRGVSPAPSDAPSLASPQLRRGGGGEGGGELGAPHTPTAAQSPKQHTPSATQHSLRPTLASLAKASSPSPAQIRQKESMAAAAAQRAAGDGAAGPEGEGRRDAGSLHAGVAPDSLPSGAQHTPTATQHSSGPEQAGGAGAVGRVPVAGDEVVMAPGVAAHIDKLTEELLAANRDRADAEEGRERAMHEAGQLREHLRLATRQVGTEVARGRVREEAHGILTPEAGGVAGGGDAQSPQASGTAAMCDCCHAAPVWECCSAAPVQERCSMWPPRRLMCVCLPYMCCM